MTVLHRIFIRMIDFKSFVMAVRVGTFNFELKLLRSPKHPTGTVHHYDDEPELSLELWCLVLGSLVWTC